MGVGRSPFPLRDEAAVLQTFGGDHGAKLLDELRQWEDDFYGLPATGALPLAELGRGLTVVERADSFREQHPEASEASVRALSWACGYDNR